MDYPTNYDYWCSGHCRWLKRPDLFCSIWKKVLW
jgi:hypothetical protein